MQLLVSGRISLKESWMDWVNGSMYNTNDQIQTSYQILNIGIYTETLDLWLSVST